MRLKSPLAKWKAAPPWSSHLTNDNLYEGNESYMVTGAVHDRWYRLRSIRLKPGRFTVTDDETKPSIALSVSRHRWSKKVRKAAI